MAAKYMYMIFLLDWKVSVYQLLEEHVHQNYNTPVLLTRVELLYWLHQSALYESWSQSLKQELEMFCFKAVNRAHSNVVESLQNSKLTKLWGLLGLMISGT